MTQDTIAPTRPQRPGIGGRAAAAGWHQSRAATFDSGRLARAMVGRCAVPTVDPGSAPGGMVGHSEWRHACRPARRDMAMAGSGSHVTSGTLGTLDLRATDRFPRRG
ncbi:MAG: hypothetical protein RLY86_1758 [Pseudomonadota bacterium]|jgi:hypothetical protein